MPKKRQALVEFEDILGACNAVNYAADNQIYFAGHPAFVNYSTSQKISRPGDSDDARGVNNVLLFTILNPIYSITTVSRAGLCGALLGFGVTSVVLLTVLNPMCSISTAGGALGCPSLVFGGPRLVFGSPRWVLEFQVGVLGGPRLVFRGPRWVLGCP